jgi:hypothetical protein
MCRESTYGVARETRGRMQRGLAMSTRRLCALLTAVALGVGLLLAVPVSAGAATLTLYPNGHDTSNGRTGSWTVSPVNSWATSLRSDDGNTSYAGGPTTANLASVFFTLDSTSAPSGVITGVRLTARAAPASARTCTMKLGVAGSTGASALQPTAQTLPASTAYNTYTYNPPTNAGGTGWTWADIASLRAVVEQTTRPSGGTRQLRVSQVSVTVTYSPLFTINSSAGANGSISPSGANSVVSGSNQTYTITPNAGYHVSDVTVDGVSHGAITSYTFNNVTTDHTISATFAVNTYTITTSPGANGAISPSSPSVSHGANQSFLITPNTGYHVVDVVVDGASQGALGSYTFYNVTAAGHTISATFAVNVFVITTSPGANGTISPPSPGVGSGASQTLSITPNAGYHVASVTVDGMSQGALTSYTFSNVTSNHTISATFALNTYTITTSAGANGTISPSSPTVNHGATQAFSITPNTNYHVASVMVDGASQGALTSYTFSSVTSSHTISATFALNTYTITTSAGANGTISPSSPSVSMGANQVLSITPSTGYHVSNVMVDGASLGALTSYTFYNVTANHTVSATFALNTYTITTSPGANGTISPSSPSVNHGANQTFSITPNTGYHVAAVIVDGVGQGALTSWTFSNVIAAHTISASFAANSAAFAVVSAVSSGVQSVDVVFSQPINGSTVQVSDFSVAGLTISNPVLQSDGVTVRLTTNSQTPGQSYTVNVGLGSIRDVNGNAVVAPLTATFTGHSGPWVETVPSAGLTLTFSQATQAGTGASAVVPPSRHPAPVNCSLLPGSYFDVTTMTHFSGTVTVALHYNPSEVTGNAANLRMFHWKNGAWQDITTLVNTSNNTVSGLTDSFSDYTLGEPTGGGGTGGIGGTTSTPASSDWSLLVLAILGIGLLVHSRARKNAAAR